MLKPYITSILTAMVLSYAVYPLYKKLNQKIKRKNISAILVVLICVSVILLPFALLIEQVTIESQTAYKLTKQKINGINAEDHCNNSGTIVCLVTTAITKLNSNEQLNNLLENSYSKISEFLLKIGSEFIFAIPTLVLNIFIIIFLGYYFLLEGTKIIEYIFSILPITDKHMVFIENHCDKMIKGILYGQLIVAGIQGSIATLGYLIFGIKSPILWGIFTALFSLVPFIGTSIIWVPASLYLFLNGIIADSSKLIWMGFGLFIYGATLISTIDNVIRPKLIGKNAKVHPGIVLLGILGGLHIFGFIGLILGPLILASCLVIFEVYLSDNHEIKS